MISNPKPGQIWAFNRKRVLVVGLAKCTSANNYQVVYHKAGSDKLYCDSLAVFKTLFRKLDLKGFRGNLERSRITVSTWPKWKKDCMLAFKSEETNGD